MKTQSELFRLAASGVEVLYLPGASGDIAEHLHAAWCLVAVTRGRRRIAWAGGRLDILPAQAALIPAMTVHACSSPDGPCAFFALTFSAPAPSGPTPPALLPAGQGVESLHAALGAGDCARAATLARELAGTLSDCQAGRALSPCVARAKGLLDGLDESCRSLSALAERSGASRSHLCRAFRREVGLAPADYRALSMLRLARGRLAQGQALCDAAQDSGFYDQSHLTRRFKKYMGITPALFARAAR